MPMTARVITPTKPLRPRTKTAPRKPPTVPYDMNGRPDEAADVRPTTAPGSRQSFPLGHFLGLEPGPSGDFRSGLGVVALSPAPSSLPVRWSPLPRDPLTGKRGDPERQRPSTAPGATRGAATGQPDMSSINTFRAKKERPDAGPLDRPGLQARPEWDGNHSINFSRNNEAFPKSLREYFPAKPPVPLAKESQHRECFAPFGHVEGKPGLFNQVSQAVICRPSPNKLMSPAPPWNRWGPPHPTRAIMEQ
jgi:hypothetical protein